MFYLPFTTVIDWPWPPPEVEEKPPNEDDEYEEDWYPDIAHGIVIAKTMNRIVECIFKKTLKSFNSLSMC